ncbi:hypothetical protein HanIR_Chr15g0785271 [Helianthus annuus]|nr:hypothetical protein HanIR_Chr15g0785271 [Helianthus annuus]
MVSGTGTSIKFGKPVIFSVPVRHRYSPVFTLKHRCCTSIDRYRTVLYRTRYIQYRYPLLGISVTVFSVPVGTELIKSCSNVTMQVIASFRLLFIHTVSKLYFILMRFYIHNNLFRFLFLSFSVMNEL